MDCIPSITIRSVLVGLGVIAAGFGCSSAAKDLSRESPGENESVLIGRLNIVYNGKPKRDCRISFGTPGNFSWSTPAWHHPDDSGLLVAPLESRAYRIWAIDCGNHVQGTLSGNDLPGGSNFDLSGAKGAVVYFGDVLLAFSDTRTARSVQVGSQTYPVENGTLVIQKLRVGDNERQTVGEALSKFSGLRQSRVRKQFFLKNFNGS